MYGGYDKIDGGQPVEAMVDLTGGFAMSVKLKQNINRDLVFASLNSFDKRLIMTSCIMPKGARQGKKI